MSKSRLVIIFLILLSASIKGHSKPVSLVGSVPDWVVSENFNPDYRLKKSNVSDGWQNILIDQQINIGLQSYFYHYTRKIFSKVGVQNGSEIAISYDPGYEQIRFHYVKIYRNGKVIDKLDPARIKVINREKERERFIYDGMLTAILTLADVREGDLIDYAFTYTGGNPILEGKFAYSFSLQQHDPLDKILVRIIAPQNRSFQIKKFGHVKDPSIRKVGREEIYTWKLNNVDGLTLDDNIPNWYDPYPWVNVSEYRSWEEVNNWALKLFTFPVKPSVQLSLKTDSIKASFKQPSARVSAALDFVQNDIRYLGIEAGINSHKPAAPNKVLAQRYGDCKDKASLLCYLLNAMDIEAWPVLVNTQYRHELKNWLPGPGVFNHCVVQVMLSGEKIWLDPTLTHQSGPCNKLFFPNYGYGLVIKPGTKALSEIPLNTNTKTIISEQFMLDEGDSAISYRVESHYFGNEADSQRDYFESNSLQDIEKNYLNYYADLYPGILQSKELLFVEDVSNSAFKVFENYVINAFWSVAENNAGEQEATIYPQVIGGKINMPTTRIRTMPYLLEFPLHIEQTTQVFLPERWDIEKQDIEIKENGLYFSKKAVLEDKVLTISYVYKTLQPQVEASNTAAFIATQKKIKRELGYTFTRYGSGSSAAPHMVLANDFNPVSVWFILLGLVAVAFCCYKLYYFDPAPIDLQLAAYPLSIGGWLVLPGIGLVLTPLRALVQLSDSAYYSLSAWDRFNNPDSAAYNPVMQIALPAEYIFNVIMGGAAIMLFILYLKRRSNIPFLMVGFYAINVIFNVLEAVVFGSSETIQNSDVYAEMTKAIIGGAIWIPYFLKSKRVKQTFINTLHPDVAETAIESDNSIETPTLEEWKMEQEVEQ